MSLLRPFLSFFVSLLLALFPTTGWSETDRAPWVLAQGEQRILRVPGLDRYSVGGNCVRARSIAPPGGRAGSFVLLVKAVCPGQGDLWVSKQDGSSEHRRIRIEKMPGSELPPALERGLGHLEEAEVLLAGAGVVLRGEIRSVAESSRIRRLVSAHPKEIHDETVMAEELVAEARAKLDAWVRSDPRLSNLRVERHDRGLVVRGSLDRPSLVASAERRIRSIHPQAIVELDSMPDGAPTVYFRVFLLELRKARSQSLGLAWPAMQEGAFKVTPSGITHALALDVALQALEAEGSARVLSNPELVVRAPGEAELFAGGELPIRTKTAHQSSVVWKNHGLTLQLKVSHTSGDRVRLEIFTEVSHLDAALAHDEVPGIQANRMKTQVDARYGVPLLLSGLLQHGTREQARGLPLLRQIPVLGRLFGSEDYLSERSELVAILLPASAPPSQPSERVTRHSPLGPAPLPREWVSPSQERALRSSPEWPWNALR